MLQMPNISLIIRTKYVFDTDYNGKVKKNFKKLHKKREPTLIQVSAECMQCKSFRAILTKKCQFNCYLFH